jgi:hypothetical protein
VTVAIDADGQMDPTQMSALIDAVAEGVADYAKGNRLADDVDREAMPPFRRVGNWMLTYLTKLSSGYWDLMDPQNGYTAISGDALDAIDVASLSAGHEYTNDLLVRLRVADMSVADVPIPAVYADEDSTIDYVEFIPTTSMTLARGFLWRLDRTYVPGPATVAAPTRTAGGDSRTVVAATDGGTAGSDVTVKPGRARGPVDPDRTDATTDPDRTGTATGPGGRDSVVESEQTDVPSESGRTDRAIESGRTDRAIESGRTGEASDGQGTSLSSLVAAFLGGALLAWLAFTGRDPETATEEDPK